MSGPSTGATNAQDSKRNEVAHQLIALLPDLRQRALRLTRGDAALADDIVQDSYERALRFAASYEAGTHLRAWAMQVLFSVFITKFRRIRREREALRVLGTDPCAWTRLDAFVEAAGGGLTKATEAHLRALPDGFRDAIVLVDLEERSYRDAAATLGVPVGTVMSRLHRGRKLLAGTMKTAA